MHRSRPHRSGRDFTFRHFEGQLAEHVSLALIFNVNYRRFPLTALFSALSVFNLRTYQCCELDQPATGCVAWGDSYWGLVFLWQKSLPDVVAGSESAGQRTECCVLRFGPKFTLKGKGPIKFWTGELLVVKGPVFCAGATPSKLKKHLSDRSLLVPLLQLSRGRP